MSTSVGIDTPLPLEGRPQAEFLGSILGEELWWDGGPWWSDAEPMRHTYDLDGTIRADYLCDVNRLPDYIRVPKVLSCGHGVRGSEIYVTWLDTDEDVCLACATEIRR
jgi:hypothetical protein